MIKTRLIFTLYTIYGILFKGESCAYVRAHGVCSEGQGDVAERTLPHAARSCLGERRLSLPRSLCARVYVHRIRAHVGASEEREERGRGWLCACVFVSVTGVNIQE